MKLVKMSKLVISISLLILMVYIILITSSLKLCTHIKEKGLKNITEEIWEGKQH